MEGREESGGPTGWLGGVMRPSRSVVRPSWRDGRGREARPEDREGSEGPLEGPNGIVRLS